MPQLKAYPEHLKKDVYPTHGAFPSYIDKMEYKPHAQNVRSIHYYLSRMDIQS